MGVGYMRWVLYLAMDLLLDRQQDLGQDHMTSAEAHSAGDSDIDW